MIEKRRKRKEELENKENECIDSDERFAFIAGYTPGGAPYGIGWDEEDTFTDEQDDELPWGNL